MITFSRSFSTVSTQHLLFVPNIDKIKPNGAAEDFHWRDIQLSKGKVNLPSDMKIIIINEKEENLRYWVVPCAGVKHANCPVYFVYIEPSVRDDQQRWCSGLVIHPKEPRANLHTHADPPPSSLQSSTIAALEDVVTRCPSLTPQSVSQGVGVGYMLPLADKAACNNDRIRYHLKKAQGPKLDPNTVIAQFEQFATEIDELDERGAGPLTGGPSVVETSQEKYRH